MVQQFACFGVLTVVMVPLAPTALLAQPSGRLLYVMNVDGTGLRQLVKGSDYDRQGSPEWSPDGKRRAFDGWRASAGENLKQGEMFLINSDGSDLQKLGDGAMPSFSSDGQRIAFSRHKPNQGVWTMNLDGTEKVLLDPKGWCARWSPDGRRIA